ncbi:redoxin domain-containing protein [Psychromicrobium lacuslunae]|uniref:Thioredoxin domain-containing protein n=1 Tax=Psychromicrobium lacuslunae TaxID=1618207 RepID=A0A0D4BYM3_9MICC|nr:redoxin domain-containing protein [Psychromicrobium lacuslunae]AJT41201.1 hypothetical protein UM93_06140 [Psychromicrobium lacuslunae]
MTMLKPGARLPDFNLENQFGERVLSDGLLGRRLLLVFYPFAFSPTCGSEWFELKEHAESFTAAAVSVLGVSTDTKYALRAYAEAAELPFEFLSDFWPHGEVSRAFGVFNETRGMAERGSFLFDELGLLQVSFGSPSSTARSWESYQDALTALAAK